MEVGKMKIIGLIPARKGSKRIIGKNMALLGGKPLLQRAIETAKASWFRKIFDEIVVSTDWKECADLAKSLGVGYIMRPSEISQELSHDYEWVKHALDIYTGFDLFIILRPTSPFRTMATIERALYNFEWSVDKSDSLRAVSKTSAHPRKSWIIDGGWMIPYQASKSINGFPPYDMATQVLGEVYCQNGCIHIARTDVLKRFGNVSGEKIAPFFTIGYEGVDINTRDDLQYAEWLIQSGKITEGGH
jgi:CMP-N-acetylneuraminic acid synthetase